MTKSSLVSAEWEPDPKVARRFGVCQKTVQRWSEDPALDFPPAMEINGRKYRNIARLEAWSAARVKASIERDRGAQKRSIEQSIEVS
jgi:hypothetical protein